MDEPAALPSMPRLDRISITPAGKAWAAQKDLGRDRDRQLWTSSYRSGIVGSLLIYIWRIGGTKSHSNLSTSHPEEGPKIDHYPGGLGALV
ncbi:Os07g0443302 [Oryza sativa Japonica Group]|uniref:Os07g0443302 protein n=1 Tax=Oryza sativa subsp. japonica TaxID=39947 RepID=A0A0P0X5L2_ORYSJ|nr:Os07g0443302 [Oryza sativa Japonica Group]